MNEMRSAKPGARQAADALRSGAWLVVLRRYLLFSMLAHLAWEILQMPFFTIWKDGTVREIAFAIIHCTAGDVLIATSSLLAALLVLGNRKWPEIGYARTATLTLIIGLTYTIFSEWLNTEIRGAWTYADIMPVVPLIGTGFTPLLQWLVVPAIGLMWSRASAVKAR